MATQSCHTFGESSPSGALGRSRERKQFAISRCWEVGDARGGGGGCRLCERVRT